ncbi:MAG: histidine kinase dimerization/phosphoacceptor domain -containing protein [Dehalococcoidia bacterium]|nr:histidine kinase dimerization/phosphoacceptor domain -containing protein [Dehalococcoidia bacterium]
MRIQTKILGLILTAVLLTATIGTLIGRTVATDALEDQAKDNLSALAQSRTQTIRNLIEYQKQSIELLASQSSAYQAVMQSGSGDLGFEPDDLDAISYIMQNMTANNKYVWQALYLNADGIVVASSFRPETRPVEPYPETGNPEDWTRVDYSQIDWAAVDPAQIDWSAVDYSQIDWPQIDLSRIDWSKIDYNKIDYSRIDLSKIDYSKIDWSKIDLSRVDWSKISIPEIDFSKVDLSKIDWAQGDMTQNDVYLKGKEGTYVGNVALYEDSRDFVLAVSAPFYSDPNRKTLKGVMVYLGGEDELCSIAADRRGLGDTGEVYLINEEGYMLTPSLFVEDAMLRQSVVLPESFGEVEETGAITRENYLGTKVFGVYHRLPGTPWVIAVEKSRSEVLEPVTDLTRKMLWAMLTLLGFWIALAFFLSRRISAPIMRLRQGAERIMKGDWSIDVSIAAKDEVGDLSRAFSAMTANLMQSQKELQQYSTGLEQQVAERTKELSGANEELNQARNKLEKRVEDRTQQLVEINTALEGRINEREVLLKEIHHRVKNNLQIISSLLNLQKDSFKDEPSRAMFEDSGRRVRSMALIHEQLYRSGNLAQIDFRNYVRELTGNLLHSYVGKTQGIRLDIQGEGLFLGIDAAVPCGLMINELITNSIKYAFPEGWQGSREEDLWPEIKIELGTNNAHELIILVADNGIGLPENIDYRNTRTLGLQLVSSLTNQLGATMEVERRGGTLFRISIPEQGWKQGA